MQVSHEVIQMRETKRTDSVISNSPSIAYSWDNVVIKTKPARRTPKDVILRRETPGVKTILRGGDRRC